MGLDQLREIGLTLREIKVYKALLELGSSSAGGIIKKSGIPNSKIYETLDKLSHKGLVGSVLKENKRYYQANDPQAIIEFLEERKKKIQEEVLPVLKLSKNIAQKEEEATVYEGIRSIKSVYEKMLRETKPHDEILVLGASSIGQQVLEPYLLNWNKRRIKNAVTMRIIYFPEARAYGKLREKMKITKVKYLHKGEVAPAWVDVFADYIVTFDFSSSEPSAFIIKSKAISQSYKNYFEILWEKL
jgi:HTH-type transcriptional regulator, sugar sensing transcriptional regulator